MDRDLHRVIDDIDEDEKLQWVSKKIQFFLSEEMSEAIMRESLTELRDEYVRLREEPDGLSKVRKKGRSWWSFFGY